MAEFTGSALYATFGGTVLSGNQRTLDWTDETETVDASAGSDAARTYLTVLTNGNASMNVLEQGAGTVSLALRPKAEGSLIVAPYGTASGASRMTVNAILTTVSISHPYDGIVETTLDFQFSGAITYDTY